MTLPLPLPPVPLAPVPLAPVPLAPVPMAVVTTAPRSMGPALPAPEAWPPAPAIIEFRGFPHGSLGAPPRAVLLADAGDPVRAARWFQTALASAVEPTQFAAACLRTAPAPLEPLGGERGDTRVAYRYRLGLAPTGGDGLRLQCWRCYGQPIGWQRRCGPMALGAFVAHFGAKGPAPSLGG